MAKAHFILAVAGTLALALAAGTAPALAQSLPSEGAKSGSIFSQPGTTSLGAGAEPYRSPSGPPPDTAKRGESPALDPRQGPGASPLPSTSYGDTVQKQNDEAKRLREMIDRKGR